MENIVIMVPAISIKVLIAIPHKNEKKRSELNLKSQSNINTR